MWGRGGVWCSLWHVGPCESVLRGPFTGMAPRAAPTSVSPPGLGPKGQAPSRQGTCQGAGRGTGLLGDRRIDRWTRHEAEGEGAASETRGPSSHRALGVGGSLCAADLAEPRWGRGQALVPSTTPRVPLKADLFCRSASQPRQATEQGARVSTVAPIGGPAGQLSRDLSSPSGRGGCGAGTGCRRRPASHVSPTSAVCSFPCAKARSMVGWHH